MHTYAIPSVHSLDVAPIEIRHKRNLAALQLRATIEFTEMIDGFKQNIFLMRGKNN